MKLRLFLAGCLATTTVVQALELDSNEILAAHNRWRTSVGVPPLKYSIELARASQTWADHLKQDNHCQMKHSDPSVHYGENLYWSSAVIWSDGKRDVKQMKAKKVVDDWAGERADYNYASNHCAPGKVCGHYTQVIWRTTTTVGCAIAVCDDTRDQVWVCRYQPPGNWVGEKPY
jgi:pathogenesis-related protein 1